MAVNHTGDPSLPVMRGLFELTCEALGEAQERVTQLEVLLHIWCDHDFLQRANDGTYWTEDWGYQVSLTPEQSALMDEVLQEHIDDRYEDIT